MKSSTMAYARLHLTPHFNPEGDATSIGVKQTFKSPGVKAGGVLCVYQTRWRHFASCQYQEADIKARDERGSLIITFSPSHKGNETEHSWVVDRDTTGDVDFSFEAVVPAVYNNARAGLQQDQGGLFVVGISFLPRLPGKDEDGYQSIVEWDLSAGPPGTQGVWTYGEGPAPVVKEGKADTLSDSIFMFGPVQRYPPLDGNPCSLQEANSCAFYWFGELPSSLAGMKEFGTAMFKKQTAHFKDADSNYRIFVRKAARGFGPSHLPDATILEYDEEAIQEEDDAVFVRVINREMIQNWVGLDPEDGGNSNAWYSQGIAQLYTVFFPFRFGFRTPDYFRATLNAFLTEYYTNPNINVPMKDVQDKTCDGWYVDSIPKSRGFLYILKMDCYTRRASKKQNLGVLRPIDDIIVKLAQRRR
ncbi:hypothetical protein BJ170DRAFT_441351 [Xylariales sp. AK1849]|nr:hypothetical protein BJ170DRAFT_441351 [Xylariales sp. AK1849]